MPHDPDWHILDNNFASENDGLVPLARKLGTGGTVNEISLMIVNLDRNDPPGYREGIYPRAATFNGNVFRITAVPRMPELRVQCEAIGFDPGEFPIYWQLKCRHVLCRHQNQGQYRYRGVCEVLNVEWQGKSRKPDFTLFHGSSDPDIVYDFNTNTPDTIVMGGHAILTVAAWPVQSDHMLSDYVHLRIGGANPSLSNVLDAVDNALAGRNQNIIHMVRAIFAHESNFTHFRDTSQMRSRMTFRQVHHGNDTAQPDCPVRFNWPNDPANFPLATFDYGIGISQYTKVVGRTLGPAVIWDWRENIKIGINLFFNHLRALHDATLTWRQWARPAWRRYNGAGAAAEQYANDLLASAEGQQVSAAALPVDLDVAAQTAYLPQTAAPDTAPEWPPSELSVR